MKLGLSSLLIIYSYEDQQRPSPALTKYCAAADIHLSRNDLSKCCNSTLYFSTLCIWKEQGNMLRENLNRISGELANLLSELSHLHSKDYQTPRQLAW